MSDPDVVAIINKKADELKKEYKGLKGILEEDRDDYNYYSGMIDGINNLLIELSGIFFFYSENCIITVGF
mgnify:CR=1 FL=1